MSEILRIDEEFKNLIPPLADDEYKGLEASIIAEGCRDSIVTWQGIIIDGHNRYEICTANGLEFNTINRDFQNRNEVIMWIIRNQFGRRNLPIVERVKLAYKLESYIAAKAKENQRIHGGTAPGKSLVVDLPQVNANKTREELAKLAGVSPSTIQHYKKIEKEATPEVKADLNAGKISINQAYETVKNTGDRIFRQPKNKAALDNSGDEYKKRLAFDRQEKARLKAEQDEILKSIKGKVRNLLNRVPESEHDKSILAIVEWLNSLLKGGTV